MNITGRPEENINLMLEATVFSELSLATIDFINQQEVLEKHIQLLNIFFLQTEAVINHPKYVV